MHTLTRLTGGRYGMYLNRLLLLFALVSGGNAMAQPTFVEGTWVNGGPFDNNIGTLTDRGVTRFYRAISNNTNTNSTVLFNNPLDDYNPKWAASSAGIYPVNQLHTNGAIFNGGTDLNFSTVNGRTYTHIIGENSGSANNYSVLETSYTPKDIVAVTDNQLGAVGLSQTVTVVAQLSAVKSVGEEVILRWSTDAFATVNNFAQMTFSAGTSYQATIPAQAAGTTIAYYVFTSVTATPGGGANQLSGTTADYLSLNIFNQGGQNVSGANYSYTVQNAITSASTGTWATPGIWNGGAAPGTTNNVIIRSGHVVTLGAAATIASLTIVSGGTYNGGAAQTLTIRKITSDAACPTTTTTLTNNGTFTAATGTIIFDASGAVSPNHRISGTITFNNVQVTNATAGQLTGLDFGTASTIGATGTFTLNTRGFVCTNAPTYSSGSTLLYNTTFTAGSEWYSNATTGQGVPSNVTIANTFTLTMNGTSTDFRQCNLNFTKTGNVTLSGCDLKVGGGFSGAGTFTMNNKAIFFVGGFINRISVASTFDYMVINKTAGRVELSGVDVTVNGPSSGNSLTFSNATSKLNLNGRTLTLGSLLSMGSGSFMAGINSGAGSGTLILQNGAGAPNTGFMGTVNTQSDSAFYTLITLNRPAATSGITFGNSLRAVTFTYTAGPVMNISSGATFRVTNTVATPTALQNITVNGVWTLDASLTLASTTVGSTLLISGNGASVTCGSSLTISASGTTAVTITSGAGSAANLTTGPAGANFNSGTVTVTNTTIPGTINSGGVSGTGTTVTLNNGTWNISGSNGWTGTFNPGTSTVNYTAAGAQNVRGGVTYYNVNFQGAISTKTMVNAGGGTFVNTAGTLTIAGTLDIGASAFTINSGTTIAGTGTINVGTGSAGGFLDCLRNWDNYGLTATNNAANVSIVTITGNINTAGTFAMQSKGTIVLDGAWTAANTVSQMPLIFYYRGNSAQTIRTSILYNRLRLKGANKNLNPNAVYQLSDSLNLMGAVNMVFPTNTSPQVTQFTVGLIVGSGKITPDATARLTINGASSTLTPTATHPYGVLSPAVGFNAGTLGFLDITRTGAMANLILTTDLTVGRYTLGGGHIRMVNGSDFNIVGTAYAGFTSNPTGAGLLYPGTASIDKYISLDQNSYVNFTPHTLVTTGTPLIFPMAMSPIASPVFDLGTTVAVGTFSSSNVSTAITGVGTTFTNDITPGDLFVRGDGVTVGRVASIGGATAVTLLANALQTNAAGTTFRVIRMFKPVTLIPNTDIPAGTETLSLTLKNHSGGGTTNATNVAPSASTRRANFIIEAGSTGATSFGMNAEALLSGNYNQTMTQSQLGIFRTTGTLVWEKYAQTATAAGSTGNIQIQRSSVGAINSDKLFTIGQTGGDLPNDPTFTWIGTTTDWTTTGNWIISGAVALYPNSPAHFVTIGAGGTASPVLPASSITVFTVNQNAKSLTVPNLGTLNVFGNYNLNFPSSSLLGGTGTLSNTAYAATGVGTSFNTQLIPGSYLFRANDNQLIGVVQSVASATALTIARVGEFSDAIENLPAGTGFNYITPAINPGIGTITASTAANEITITGGSFTSSMLGRVILDNTNAYLGVINAVDNAAAARFVSVSTVNYTGTFSIMDPIPTSGSGTVNFQTGSTVNYNANITQTIAHGTYYNMGLNDSRSLASTATDILRLVPTTGQTITINGTFSGRTWVKFTPITGTTFQFGNTSKIVQLVPGFSGGSIGAGQIWRNYEAFNGHPGIIWGTSSAARIDLTLTNNRNATGNYQGPDWGDLPASGRLGNMSITLNAATSAFSTSNGSSWIVNGNATFVNNSAASAVVQLGNAASPICSMTFYGAITGANQIIRGGAPANTPNISVLGSGAVSGDLFANFYTTSGIIVGMNNLTINRPGYTATLTSTATRHIVCSGTLTVSAGSVVIPAANNGNFAGNTFIVNGTGSVTANGTNFVGSGAGGVFVAGNGSVTVVGNSNFGTVASPGDVTISGNAIVNLAGGTNATGHGSTQDWIQTGGTVTLPTSATCPFGVLRTMTISGGTMTKVAGNVSIGSASSVTGGDFQYNGGTVDFSGASLIIGSNVGNQTFSSTSNKTLSVSNLLVTKTAGNFEVASGKIRLLNLMTVTGPAIVTANTGNITLVSTATSTASIAALPSAGSVAGNNWTMERYVGGTSPGWYLAGTPIKGQTLGDWSDDTFIFTLTGPCGVGLIGNTTTSNVFTFDGTAPPVGPNPDVEQNGWRLSDCSLPHGVGKRIYFGNQFFASSTRLLDNTGEINAGPFNFSVPYNAAGYSTVVPGWNLVANPYPSSIRWSGPGWTKTNMDGAYYGWNGTLAAYGACNASGVGSAPWITDTIASSQAFFVRANAVGAVLTASEAVKKTPSNRSFLREAVYSNLLRMKVASNDNQKADYVVIMFHPEASEGYDEQWDATKFSNPFINLSSSGAGMDMAINAFADLNEDRIIPLTLTVQQPGQYQFSFTGLESFDAGIQMYLRDNYLGEISPITEGSVQNIDINGDAGSQGADRFEIVFSPEAVTATKKAISSFATSVVPNPSNGNKLTLLLQNAGSNQTKVMITDMLGKVLMNQDFVASGNAISLEPNLAAGVYQVLISNAGKTSVQKIVVNK